MLVQGDFSLDSMQMYSDSFKEALKQTMLSQEVMFREQVLQLHQLYSVQRILMQNFGFKELDRCSFKKAGMKPTFMPYAYPTRYDPLMKETEVSSICMLEKHPAKNYKLQHRPINLQLPPDQYISLIDLEELDLSLDLKIGHPGKENDEEILPYKKSCRMLSEKVIDLEDSVDGDTENVYSFDLNVPIMQSIESEKSHDHISNDHLPTKNEQLGACEAGYLDLNETQNDDLIMTCYSTSGSSPGFEGAVSKGQQANCSSPIWVREKNNCSTGSSTLEQDANLDVMDCGSRNERTETHSTESKFRETSTGDMNNCQYDEAPMGSTANFSKDFINRYDEESKKFEAVIEPPADRHARLQKSEVCSDCSHAVEDGCNSILTVTVSGVSTCNAENDSVGEKKGQILSLPMSNQCHETQKKLHNIETIFSSEQDHKSSGSIESEHDAESSEMKVLLQNAVETLICMSLADSAFDHDCNTKTESNDMGKDQVDQPQHSCDSFELLVLEQTQNDEDDEFSISSSQLFEVTDMTNMNFGVKLRRGRRLKDFRRDILPGLSCLSRHEICEDINIMEAVLRSKEYRKIQAKMQDGRKGCSTPMKSKRSRSRLNNTRRRIIL
ncbi:uncharacterized protein LOC120067884 [Benincasa hispida]|uniref:uncharacterized protein LOC120067884 n=1 Tax=Benincasa hispida TaxID=102211 RepID=UPI0018FFD895|nr:uncharacterized protein LOC120067884 [Benincasa hispida]XP_038875423.1 uncharacterized protein LOC120067884 [Benincasa hispida]XP_038875424.1 uncharacterized protein LOC120067884 [Benincasa hispida]